MEPDANRDSISGYPPLFIVGCGRSGTTMLRLMLDSHPDLAIPGEGHFIPYNYKTRRRFSTPDGFDSERLALRIIETTHFRRWGVPEALAMERVRALQTPDFAGVIEALYMAYAEANNKVRWGDKTPVYVRQIPLLAELFPSSRFVHVIRDGHDVALSYLSVPWGPSTIWQVARKWTRDVSDGRRDGRTLGAGRYIEVRYEDLVSAPAEQLQRICALADLPFTTKMLEYHSDAGNRLQVQPGTTEYHQAATRPPTSGLRDWRTQMSPAQIEAFEAVAGETLMDLGYERQEDAVRPAKRAEVLARGKLLGLKAVGSKAKKRMLPAGSNKGRGER